MTIIAITNQKGGVGKTTTAINLTAGLSMQGKKTLLVDTDPQANSSKVFLPPNSSHSTVYEAMASKVDVSAAIISLTDHLHLLPSDVNLAAAENELRHAIGGHQHLHAILKDLKTAYDFIIIDSPPSLGMLTLNGLVAADYVVIPVTAGVFALQGVAELRKTIERVIEQLNSEITILGVLMTQHNTTNVAKDVHDLLCKTFGDKVFQTVIPTNVKVEEAHSQGQSVLTYAPNSKGAKAYQSLVLEVMNRV